MTPARPALSRSVLVVPAAVGVALVALPLLGLLLRTDWPNLLENLSAPVVWPAIRLSLVTTLVTVALCFVLGTPLAWLLSRADGAAATWLRAVMTVPVVLPPVVGGVALLMAYGRRGVVGGPLFEAFGLRLPFTPSAVVLAQVFVSLPFFVLAVEGAMRALDHRYDDVGRHPGRLAAAGLHPGGPPPRGPRHRGRRRPGAGPGPSASSAPPSPSPATSPARPRPPRSPST